MAANTRLFGLDDNPKEPVDGHSGVLTSLFWLGFYAFVVNRIECFQGFVVCLIDFLSKSMMITTRVICCLPFVIFQDPAVSF